MAEQWFTEFETPLGRCALVWGARGILGLLLPERSRAVLAAAVQRRFPKAVGAAPSRGEQCAIEAVRALMRGEPADLSSIVVDLSHEPPFHQRVYGVTRAIPRGATLTYGEVATRLGDPGASRAVGQALGRNPVPVIVPCHRVLAAGGAAGGFSAPGGIETKQRLLAVEGVELAVQPGLFSTPLVE